MNKDEPDAGTQEGPTSHTTHCNALHPHSVRRPDLKISGIRFNLMKLPCVYAWLRGSRWMYVGMSIRGMGRPLDYSHHVMRTMAPEDTLLVWRFKKQERALRFERRLIQEKNPCLNVTANPRKGKEPVFCARCGDEFNSGRKWQRFCSNVCRWRDWNDNHPN